MLGRKTFDLILQHPAAQQAFSGVEIVLLSAAGEKTTDRKVAGNPEQAITYLQKKGFSEITIGGGTQCYNAFLQKDLVTGIYLNIIPIVTGNGGIIGTKGTLFTRFELAEHRLIADGVIQLHLNKPPFPQSRK